MIGCGDPAVMGWRGPGAARRTRNSTASGPVALAVTAGGGAPVSDCSCGGTASVPCSLAAGAATGGDGASVAGIVTSAVAGDPASRRNESWVPGGRRNVVGSPVVAATGAPEGDRPGGSADDLGAVTSCKTPADVSTSVLTGVPSDRCGDGMTTPLSAGAGGLPGTGAGGCTARMRSEIAVPGVTAGARVPSASSGGIGAGRASSGGAGRESAAFGSLDGTAVWSVGAAAGASGAASGSAPDGDPGGSGSATPTTIAVMVVPRSSWERPRVASSACH